MYVYTKGTRVSKSELIFVFYSLQEKLRIFPDTEEITILKLLLNLKISPNMCVRNNALYLYLRFNKNIKYMWENGNMFKKYETRAARSFYWNVASSIKCVLRQGAIYET